MRAITILSLVPKTAALAALAYHRDTSNNNFSGILRNRRSNIHNRIASFAIIIVPKIDKLFFILWRKTGLER